MPTKTRMRTNINKMGVREMQRFVTSAKGSYPECHGPAILGKMKQRELRRAKNKRARASRKKNRG